MRNAILCLLCLAALAGAGCGATTATTGWKFEVGRPAVLSVPMSLQQTTGDVIVGGVATGSPSSTTLQGRAGAIATVEQLPPPRAMRAAQPRAALAISEECTMEEMCRLLRGIDEKLSRGQTEQLAMPKGKMTGTRPCD